METKNNEFYIIKIIAVNKGNLDTTTKLIKKKQKNKILKTIYEPSALNSKKVLFLNAHDVVDYSISKKLEKLDKKTVSTNKTRI